MNTITVITNTNTDFTTSTTDTTSTTTTTTSTTDTTTSTTDTTTSTTTSTDTEEVPAHSLMEYVQIVTNAITEFFEDEITCFYPIPKFKKSIAELKSECYSEEVEKNFYLLTWEKIDEYATEYAKMRNVSIWRIVDDEWKLIEFLAEKTGVTPILLAMSESYHDFIDSIDD